LDVLDLSKIEFGDSEAVRPATAFALPESDDVWVGYRCDVYVLRDSGIVGVVAFSSSLNWYESVVIKKASSDQQILEAVPSSREICRFHLMNDNSTSLRSVFANDYFCQKSPLDALGCRMKRSKIKCEDGLITVTIENTETFRKGTVWADPVTGEVVRATEGGIQTFPKS